MFYSSYALKASDTVFVKARHAPAIVALFALVSLAGAQPKAANQPVPQAPSSSLGQAPPAGDVVVVDESRLEDLLAKYTLSEPLGEVYAMAACESGNVDNVCTEAAHQQLRQAAASREANLVVVFSSAVMQSFPPRLSLKGRLYRATPR